MRTTSLGSSRDFSRVLAAGRRRRSGAIQVAALRRDEGPSRVGFAIRCPTAVTRNRVRRRLRAVVPGCLPPTGWDVVVRTDAAAATLPYQELERKVCGALQEAMS